jgi:ATP-dependent protease ClpP protease subunit
VIPARFRLPSQRCLLPCLAIACLLPAACRQQAPAPVPAPPKTVVASGSEDAGAVSSDAKPATLTQAELLKGTDWPALRLLSGDAWLDCDQAGAPPPGTVAIVPGPVPPAGQVDAEASPSPSDVAAAALGVSDAAAAPVPPVSTEEDAPVDGADDTPAAIADEPADEPRPLVDLGFKDVEAAMSPCRERGAVRLRYEGKISGDFTALVQRTAAMADRMDIPVRILDIDSTGGRVEDAMPAGDAIAGSHWTIRVRADSICHSACVLVLAAGDNREIAGKVGIHRMVRVGSQATTRAELSQELREVYGEIKEYLERNGASVAVADLMMTVPNRSLRLLDANELREYGLSGANAVQDDLDRIILARKCGDDFVKRRDAFLRAFASRCERADDRAAVDACAVSLGDEYGFPDETCAADGPLASLRRTGRVSATAAAAAPAAAAGETTAATARGTAGRGG